MMPVTIELIDGVVRLSRKASSEPSAQTHTIVLNSEQLPAVKQWFGRYGSATPPPSPQSFGLLTIDRPDGVRLMQKQSSDRDARVSVIVLSPAQARGVKDWFAALGSEAAPENPLSIDP
jgi:hypothetical protein